MKKTIFIIKDEEQEPHEFPSFLKNLEDQEHTQILFLHRENKSLANWLQIKKLMVVGGNSENIKQDGTTLQFLSYQDFLEKIFEVDVPLVI